MAFGTSLIARLGLDTAGFKSGLAGAETALNSFAGKLGAGLSIAGLEEFSRGIIEYGARVYDLGQRFGVSTDAIQRFGNAAEKNGSSMEGMAMGFNKLEIAQARALAGNDKIVEAFSNLGVTVDQLKTLSPDQLMLALGKSSLNAADMVTVLGRSALQLRPVLKGLADGSIELGDAIDKNMIKRLKEAEKSWKSFMETLRIYTAEHTLAGLMDMSRAIKDIGLDIGAATSRAHELNRALLFGNLSQIKAAMAALKEELPGHKDWREEIERRRGPQAAVEGKVTLGGGEEADTAAAKKLRERNQLSLEDLAKGPGYGAQNTASLQAIYASEQARKVKELEAQAQTLRTQQGDYAGAQTLLNRADEIRQSIGGLKESEKEVGVFKKALDDSEVLKNIEKNTKDFAIENL